MLELPDGPGFAFQAVKQLRGGSVAEADCLDGNLALYDPVERTVDDAHPASAEFALNAVFSNFGWDSSTMSPRRSSRSRQG